MFDFVNYGADKIQILLLIILRTSGVFIMAPVISDRSIPPIIKVSLALMLSLVLVAALPAPDIPLATSLIDLSGMAVKEILVGLVLGLIFRLVFMAVYTAGSLVGYQMGMAMVTQFDANVSGQVSVLGRLWFVTATLIFLAINGHHLIITALADSYEMIPPGLVVTDASLVDLMIKYTAYVFVIALKIVAPVMLTLFLSDIALGTIAKTMPTMNVFFVGIPIKIAVGLTVMAISLPICCQVLEQAIGFFDTQIRIVFLTFGEA